MRIHVVGGMGSGKTTFSRTLSAQTGWPLHSLDTVAMAEGLDEHFRPRSPQLLREAEIARIAATPDWVSEGSFLGWTRALFDHADVIVWLDTTRWTALWRVLRREVWDDYLVAAWGEPAWPARLRGLRHPHLDHLRRFVGLTWRYYAPRLDSATDGCRPAVVRELRAYAPKVVRCASAGQVTAVLRQLGAAAAPELVLVAAAASPIAGPTVGWAARAQPGRHRDSLTRS